MDSVNALMDSVAVVRGRLQERSFGVLKEEPAECPNRLKLDQVETLGESRKNQAYIFCNLNRKKDISLTPLEAALKALIFALNDSAEALVLLLLKKFRMFI